MSATIRPATPADAPACAAILNAWIDETPWIILGSSPGGGGGTFNHDVPDGNASDMIYNLEPTDPEN